MIRFRSVFFLVCAASLSSAFAASAEYYEVTEAQARSVIESGKKGRHFDALAHKSAVPTVETAIPLAVAVWGPIYGKEQIMKEAPYQAVRVDDCWYVSGSLPKGAIGGAAEAVINVADGRFLMISHGQ